MHRRQTAPDVVPVLNTSRQAGREMLVIVADIDLRHLKNSTYVVAMTPHAEGMYTNQYSSDVLSFSFVSRAASEDLVLSRILFASVILIEFPL